MKLTGAEIIIQTLIEQGVTDVFGYPGANASRASFSRFPSSISSLPVNWFYPL